MRASEGRSPPYARLLLLFSCLALFGGGGETVAAHERSAPYREVSLSQQQSLWQLLASLGHPVPGDQFYRFLDRFRSLNPDIKDIGALPVGTPIRLPLLGKLGPPRRAKPWTVLKRVVKAKASPGKPERRMVPHLAFAIGDQPTKAGGAGASKGSLDPALADGTLKSIFGALGEPYRAEGNLSLPLAGRGSISLDLSRIPLVELSDDERLLIDLRDVLPREMQELLEADSRGLKVIKPGKHGDLKGLIAQVFTKVGYASVARESFVTLGDRAKVTIRGDWVILKGEDSLLTGQLHIINLLPTPGSALPQPLKDYARKHGIVVSEILVGQPSAQKRPETGDRRPGTGDRGPETGAEGVLDASSPERLVDGLLDLLGGQYEADVEIPLAEDPEGGYRVQLHIGRLLHRNGERYILDFSGFSPPLVRLVEAHGLKVVKIGPGRPEAVIKTVLDLLQVPYEREEGRFWANLEPPERHLQVKIPGFVVFPERASSPRRRGPLLLITDVPLEAELKVYLQGKGVKIVRF